MSKIPPIIPRGCGDDPVREYCEALYARLMSMHPIVKETAMTLPDIHGYFTKHKGDISDAKVDVIVCPVNHDYGGGAQVAASIFRKGGDVLLDDFRRSDKNGGPVLIPLGMDQRGTLRCNSVCFVPMPKDQEYDTYDDMYHTLLEVYQGVFKKIDECGLFLDTVTSAFPLLGAGAAGFPAQISAEAMMKAFELHHKMPHKKDISASLIVYSDADYMAVEEAGRFLMFRDMTVQLMKDTMKNF